MQVYNQLEIDSMHEGLNDTRVPEDPMRVITVENESHTAP